MTTGFACDRQDGATAADSAAIDTLVSPAQQEVFQTRAGADAEALPRTLRGPLPCFCLARRESGGAEDAVQETCATAHHALSRRLPTRADLVCGTAVHGAAAFGRAQARSAAREQPFGLAPGSVSDERDPEEVVRTSEKHGPPVQCVAGLLSDHRRMLVLHVPEERRTAEIAQILGSASRSAKDRRHRALAALCAHFLCVQAETPGSFSASDGRACVSCADVPRRDGKCWAVQR